MTNTNLNMTIEKAEKIMIQNVEDKLKNIFNSYEKLCLDPINLDSYYQLHLSICGKRKTVADFVRHRFRNGYSNKEIYNIDIFFTDEGMTISVKLQNSDEGRIYYVIDKNEFSYRQKNLYRLITKNRIPK